MNHEIGVYGNELSKRVLCLISLVVLFCTYPYVFNLFLPLPSITILMLLTLGFVIFLIGLYKVRVPPLLLSLIAIQICAVVVSMIFTRDSEYLKQLLYIIWLFFYLVLLKSFVGLKYFLFVYNRIITIISILGAFSFFVIILTHIEPLFEYTNMDGRPGYFYYFTFTNTRYGSVIRYSGILDEPGAMAFWGMFSLLTNKLWVKDRKIELPLVVSLLFTFSLAYYIQLAFYLFFFYFNKLTKKRVSGISLVGFAFLCLVFQSKDTDFDIYKISLARFEYDEYSGRLRGNNRKELIEKSAAIFKDHPVFGIGPTAFYSMDYMADNPFEVLAKNGIWGAFFLYLPIFYCIILGRHQRDILFASFIVFLGYQQRPFHINILHYTMLYLFLFSVYYRYYQKNAFNQYYYRNL